MKKLILAALVAGWSTVAWYANADDKTDFGLDPGSEFDVGSDKWTLQKLIEGAKQGGGPIPGRPVQTQSAAAVPIPWIRIEGTDTDPLPDWKYSCNKDEAPAKKKGFCMGSDKGDDSERPIHRVTIKTFEMSKTDVTVAQYAECVWAGECDEPGMTCGANHSPDCNWDRGRNGPKPGRANDPVNCVSWDQANKFANFIINRDGVKVRLPTEAQWEYAARSRGRKKEYPWGDVEPNCKLAVIPGCGYLV